MPIIEGCELETALKQEYGEEMSEAVVRDRALINSLAERASAFCVDFCRTDFDAETAPETAKQAALMLGCTWYHYPTSETGKEWRAAEDAARRLLTPHRDPYKLF